MRDTLLLVSRRLPVRVSDAEVVQLSTEHLVGRHDHVMRRELLGPDKAVLLDPAVVPDRQPARPHVLGQLGDPLVLDDLRRDDQRGYGPGQV